MRLRLYKLQIHHLDNLFHSIYFYILGLYLYTLLHYLFAITQTLLYNNADKEEGTGAEE